LALILAASGCGTIIPDIPDMVVTQQRVEEADRLLASDPQGPIPSPELPAALVAQAVDDGPDRDGTAKISYTVEVTAPDDPPGLGEAFDGVADLRTMMDVPLESRLTLRRRLRSSLQQGQALLNSWGYYDGVADGRLDDGPAPGSFVARISLSPGVPYSLEPGTLVISDAVPLDPASPGAGPGLEDIAGELARARGQAAICPALPGAAPCPAGDLAEVGIRPGARARAEDVLAAVNRLEQVWRSGGYPRAEVTATKYSIDQNLKTLKAEIVLTPGQYIKMGRLETWGDETVKPRYLRLMVNWREGQSWNQDLAERYRETLLDTGLFKSVEIGPGQEPDQDGNHPVVAALEPAPRRTVSGSLNYDSDWGPGVSLSWEHRNVTGWADRLRIELPVWRDLAQLGLSYQRPFVFNSPNHSLLAEAFLLKERTDNYALSSASVAVGLERAINRQLRGRLQASAETGTLDEFLEGQSDYLLLGLPLTLNWNNSDSYLDPTRGLRASLLMSPYVGHYRNDFKVLKYRLEASYYHPLMGPDRLVAAVRGAVGAIGGTGPENLPSSLRFFGGGGQSVRGYEYQSIGPKNARGRPAGGATMSEASAELRFRWSETMGVTAFVDGGMVYESSDLSQVGQDLLWGGGLGFRYYSPVGPFRLDLATPLTPRDEDSRLQIYLSLGQSF
jgi:translocation and assembly module TamA